MHHLKKYSVWLCLLCFGAISASAQKLMVTNVQCEYRKNPVGIDNRTPRFNWQLQSDLQNVKQTAYRILVSDNLSLLEKNNANVWDSKKISSNESIQVPYKGPALQHAVTYYWKVMVWDNKGNVSTWSDITFWQMGLLTAKDWNNAQWIGYEKIRDTSIIAPHIHGNGKRDWGARRNVLPMLRKSFTIDKEIRRATVFICGLGHFELSINGNKIGDHFLDPGWTDYNKRALYVGFNVTNIIKKGSNALGVMLGNGFYYIPGQRYRKMTGAYGLPKLILNVVIEHTDGTTSTIITDDTWKTAPSPIIFSSIFGGEDYDATLEQPGWNTTAFNDAGWKSAVIVGGPPKLEAQTAEPVKLMQQFPSLKANTLATGAQVYDLGQNFSGIPYISVQGKKGDTVRVYTAELINEDGSANQRGSGGPAYFNYILKGEGTESWQPRFTYYGFRYLQVHCIARDSAQPKPVVQEVGGWHIRNAAPSVSSFQCSNELFNKTHTLIDWAIRSNTVSVFTDCPHREKLGWLEQTHLMGASVQYNYNVAALNRKAIMDMRYAQYDNGKVPEIAPELTVFTPPFDESPEWGSASITLPWYNYQWYGDKQSLADAYDMMQRYTAYLQKKSANNILSHGLGDWYDIGPNRPGVSQLTPQGITATAMYYYDVTIMADVAKLLGKAQDERQYRELATEIKKSFNEKFFHKDSLYYGSNSQTANAMALYMNLVEPGNRKAVVNNLVNDIRHRNNALTAGDIGYRYVLRALEDAGRNDVIYHMNNRDDVPGYGYQVKHGATALTESWQAYPSVSNNHFMLGHLMEWFYAGLCGIKQSKDGVGYNKLDIRPQPVGDITSAGAEFKSPYGLIKSSWKITGNNFELSVTVPANASATIYLPYGNKVEKVGSGEYTYSVPIK